LGGQSSALISMVTAQPPKSPRQQGGIWGRDQVKGYRAGRFTPPVKSPPQDAVCAGSLVMGNGKAIELGLNYWGRSPGWQSSSDMGGSGIGYDGFGGRDCA
jgi:hypothetical protein